jgi:hypothetical protein
MTRSRSQARQRFPLPFLKLPIGIRFRRSQIDEWLEHVSTLRMDCGEAARNPRREEPHVGIFWVTNDKLLLDTTTLSEAEDYGDFKIHPRSHADVWGQFQQRGSAPREMEYEGDGKEDGDDDDNGDGYSEYVPFAVNMASPEWKMSYDACAKNGGRSGHR